MQKKDEGLALWKFSFWLRERQESESVVLSFSSRTDSCVVVEKGRKVPPWFDRAVKYLDYGSFPDSSYEMPGGVLSYIRSHKAASAAAAACTKDRTSHQIFNSSHGGKHSSLPAWLLPVFKKKVGWARKTSHHMHESTTCVTHKHRDRQTWSQVHWHTEKTLRRGCLILLHFSSRMSLFDTMCVCVCVHYFPYE